MLKMTAIGHLGKDAEVKIHGTEAVINFNVAHTDKWKDNGVPKERTTWISCSWWTERHTIAQYLKKGTQVYIEGVPEAKVWKKADDPKPFLNCRVLNLQLLGSANRDSGQHQNQSTSSTQNKPSNDTNEWKPSETVPGDDDLPF